MQGYCQVPGRMPGWGWVLAGLLVLSFQAAAQQGEQGRQQLVCLSDNGCIQAFAESLAGSKGLLGLSQQGITANANGSSDNTQALFNVLSSTLANSSCCYFRQEAPIAVIGEVTPQLALARWLASLPPAGPGRVPLKLIADVHINALNFTNSEQILHYQQHWQDSYAMNIVDSQYQVYTEGLNRNLVANPDNAGQDPQKPRGILHPRLYYLLFYHPEVLQRFNIHTDSLSTWDGLLAAAEKVHLQPFDDQDNEPGYAFCLDLAPGCDKAVYLLAALTASLVQAHGTPQGWCWDPNNMLQLPLRPLVANRTADYLARIVRLSQPDAAQPGSCNATNNLFAGSKLRCAFTFDWDVVANFMGQLTDAQGEVLVQRARPFGALLVPGVTDPLNRTMDGYEECNPLHCPWATEKLTVNGTSALVNLAPFSTLVAVAGAMFSEEPSRSKQLTIAAFWEVASSLIPGWVVGRDKVLQQMTSDWQAACRQGLVQPPQPPILPWSWDNSGVGIFNRSDPCATPDWAQLPPGYPAKLKGQLSPLTPYFNATVSMADMQRVLPTIWQARWHSNNAPDLVVPMAAYYHAILDNLAANLAAANTSYKEILGTAVSNATDLFKMVTATVGTGHWSSNGTVEMTPDTVSFKQRFDDVYGQSINFDRNAPYNTLTTFRTDSGKRLSTAELVLLAVLPAMVVMVTLTTGGVLGVRKLLNRSLLLGHTKPPGLSPNTTLMITDIYNSTVLWETLPSTVMDTALRLHHQVIRTAAAQHRGYESALEGDAFILAFHTPLDAVQAALQAQAALLTAPWPDTLLRHPDAREVWVSLPQAAMDIPSVKSALPFRSMSAAFTGPGFPMHADVFHARRRTRSVLSDVRKQVDQQESGGTLRGLSKLFLPSSWGRRPAAAAQLAGAAPTTAADSQPQVAEMSQEGAHPAAAQGMDLQPAARTLSPLNIPNPAGSEPTPTPGSAQSGGMPPMGPSSHLSRVMHSFRIGQGPRLGSLAEETIPSDLVHEGVACPRAGDDTGGTQPLLYRPRSDTPSRLQGSNPLQSEPAWLRTPGRHFDVETGVQGPASLQHPRRESGSPHLFSPAAAAQARRRGARRHSMWAAAPPLMQRAGTMLHQWRNKLSANGTPTAPPAVVPGRSATLTRMQSWRHPSAWLGPATARSVTDSGAAPPTRRQVCLLTQYAMDDLGHSPKSESALSSEKLQSHASEPQGNATPHDAWPTPFAVSRRDTLTRQHSWSGDERQQDLTQDDQQLYSDADAALAVPHDQPGAGDVVADVEASADAVKQGVTRTQATTAFMALAPSVVNGKVEPLSYTTWKAECVAAWPLLTPTNMDEENTSTTDSPSTHPSATAGSVENSGAGSDAGSQDAARPTKPRSTLKAVLQTVTGGKLAVGKGMVLRSASGSNTAALMFRGLRVRMGLHSGVHMPSEMSLNRTTQAQAYSGYPLKLAKAVGDAAAGGMVLLSGSTFNLVAGQLAALSGNPMPVYMGDSLFDLPGVVCNRGGEGEGAWARDAVPMYCLVLPELRPRLALHEPLREVDMVQHGNLDAPTGVVCIAFVYVAGVAGLVAELGAIGTDALDMFQLMATKLCADHGGYVIEATEGLCLAVFADPAACALWGLSCVEHMKQHAWHPELLAHELCQEVVTIHPTTGQLYTQQRGPRLRAGMHTGHVEMHVNPRTGRLAYRGRVMNRAARIASKAQDGQVLSSAAAASHWAVAPLPASPAAAVGPAGSKTAPAATKTPFQMPFAVCTIKSPNSPAPQLPPQHLVASQSVGAQQLAACPALVKEQRQRLRADCVGTFALKGVSEMMTLYACTLADEHVAV